jgi:hypothetical protein
VLDVADTTSDVTNDSKGPNPWLHPASPSAVTATKPTTASSTIHAMHVDSDVDSTSTTNLPTILHSCSEPLMPATDSPKADLLSIIPKANLISSKAMALIVSLFTVISCLNSTYHGMFQDNNEELVCRAMASFVILSPPTPAPRKLTHATAPFTTPRR